MLQSLVPPSTPNRHRAHSTNLRPALTISTLGRRRSTSLDQPPDLTSPPPSATSTLVTSVQADAPQLSSPEPVSSPSMFAIIASRFLQALHVSPKHSTQWSIPSSPRSSTDEYVLPMSASSQQTTFGDVFGEKELSTAHASNAWWPSVRPISKTVASFYQFSPYRYMHLYCL